MISKLEDMSTDTLKMLAQNNAGSSPEFAALLRTMLKNRAANEKAQAARQATRELAESAGAVFMAIATSNDPNVASSENAAYKGAERMLLALTRAAYDLSAAKASATIHAMSEHGYDVDTAVKSLSKSK